MSATEDEVEVLWQPPVIPVWVKSVRSVHLSKKGLMITEAVTQTGNRYLLQLFM